VRNNPGRSFGMSLPQTSVQAIHLRMAPADIALAKFLFESYEEVGLVRTIDRRAAIIVVLVVPDFLPTARAILADLHGMIAFTEIEPPPQDADDWLMRAIDADD
jgi:hypothetical protein